MADPSIYPHELVGRTIRLLAVEPGDRETPLRCQLAEICLDTTSTSYYALSYCWGHPSLIEITCNSRPLFVTRNLHAFLLEYRHRGISIPLWVDAICIDQSNTSERTSQVRMMDQIYSRADCVVVWLGEAEATDRLAVDVLRLIHVVWASTPKVSHLDTSRDVLAHDAWLSSCVPQMSWNALAAFLLRPWFSRMWIIQEFLLARRVTMWCGARTLNEEFPVLQAMERFAHLSVCVYMTTAAVRAIEKDHARIYRMRCAPWLQDIKSLREQGSIDALSLMMRTSSFEATDPRDRMFALVGLMEDIDESFVDYSKSYQDLTKELSRMFLNGTIGSAMGSELDVLSLISRDEKHEFTEPSWVVYFRSRKSFQHVPMVWAYPSKKPVINRNPDIQFTNGEGNGSLRIRGTVVDVITHVVPFPVITENYLNTPNIGSESTKDIIAYQDWLRRVGDLIAPEGNLTTPPIGAGSYPIYKPTGESLYNAFWRTLCCNGTFTDPLNPPTDDASFAKWLTLMRIELWRQKARNMKWLLFGIAAIFFRTSTYRLRGNWLFSCARNLAFPWLVRLCYKFWDAYLQSVQVANMHACKDFDAAFSRWKSGRQFGVTSLGGICLLPISAKVGDSVGVFVGCRIPFVFRKSEERYRIVGEAYLHGCMNGEGDQAEGEMLTIV